jgi:hypothetical protein
MNHWHDIKSEFEADGSLRDIYVYQVSSDYWDMFLKKIMASGYKLEFIHSHKLMPLPLTLNTIQALQETDPTTLGIWVNDNMLLNCHFFIATEIELDLSPRDINTENDYEVLLTFLSWLANTLKKNVHLTHENSPELEILQIRYDD